MCLRGRDDERHATRIVDAFAKANRGDDVQLLYADDGRTQQAYHTPETPAGEREFNPSAP